MTMMLLGYSDKKPNFELLSGIQASKSVSIGTAGYSLSGLHPTPGRLISETGFMRAEVTLDGVKQRCVRYTPEMEGLSQNYYLKGNNEYPVLRYEASKVYIDVDIGYYPVTTELFYIREPKELVISGASGYQVTTCELDTGWHDLNVRFSEKLCRRFGDDIEQYTVVKDETMQDFMIMGKSGIASMKKERRSA
jgi:hypothetical protein